MTSLPAPPPPSNPCTRPLNLLLGEAIVQGQMPVAFLQIARGDVQLLVQLGVLLVHLPQKVHLLGEVLRQMDRRTTRQEMDALHHRASVKHSSIKMTHICFYAAIKTTNFSNWP